MTDVIAGQTVALLSQWYDFSGGSLVDLDATPTITITSIATAATALAATSSGVTHPGTGSYGYAWTPASSLAPGAYLATWTGLKSSSPVTATETITVYAPASAAATNTSPEGIWYATREDVMRALDVKETARNRRQIDDALESASRGIEGLCHRRFYPVLATRLFDWPPRAGMTPWILRLDDQGLITVATLASGGQTIASTDYNLEPVNSGPPFNRVEIKLSSDASFGGGDTYQRDVQIAGLWGYRNTETTLGSTTAAITSTTATTITVDGPTSALVGVGSVLRIDSERMLVTERTQASTGQTGSITAGKGDVTLTVANGAAFAVDEVILLDSERMRIDDIAGNTLTVERAYDGTVLAAHTTATIYAPRTLTVTRGALGTSADIHASGNTVYRWNPPGLVHQLAKAEAISQLLQERSGWFRRASSASGTKGGEVTQDALKDLRDQTYTEHGRKARHRAV
ncbi:hypothetical protein [Streptomyces sp. BK340]|uniref:hypothetical protein n=1 Tax=Streptomyces sp. BK340 TaxID=2572903 RepID=UPI0011A86168|nr:hypothetical protein [Streptomyces sp. BK340]TVZ96519.1 hypothetical protein FB157_103430 [Streptomyces sp. BK340]